MIFDSIFDRFGSDLGAMLGATSLKNRRKNELCIEVLFLLDFDRILVDFREVI